MDDNPRRAGIGRRYGRWLFPINIAAALGLCLVAGFMLVEMRRDAQERAELSSQSLIEVLGRDIARNIEGYDSSLRSVVDAMSDPKIWQKNGDELKAALFEHSPSAPNLERIVVLDRNGDLMTSSRPVANPRINLAGTESFEYLKSHADFGLHISKLQISNLSGRPILLLSRRLLSPDGSFVGVVADPLPLDYIRRLFSAIGSGYAGDIALYGPDDTLVMSEPFNDERLGKRMTDSPSYRRMTANAKGSFVGPSILGEGDRRFVYGQIGTLPLRLSVDAPSEAVDATWLRKAATLASAVIGLFAITLVSSRLLRRELQQREAAERALEDLNAALERLAVTDALTGLYNRRHFDETLQLRWKACAGDSQKLFLLMIDADLFKLYNDAYGHQMGDEVLKTIAQAIAAELKYSDDVAFRIGGEEFAVLLSGADGRRAGQIAERMRKGVLKAAIPHDGSPSGLVTISCGLAQGDPAAQGAPADLFAAADKALYAAKNAGRNVVWQDRPDSKVVFLRSA